MTSTEESKKACVLIVFGASGDLSFRKILPALYELERANLLHSHTKIIACDRQQIGREEYIDLIKGKIQQLSNLEIYDDVWRKFVDRIHYCSIELNQFEEYSKLSKFFTSSEYPAIFYMAVPSTLYSMICKSLVAADLVNPSSRVVLEKPIGHDTNSSVAISDQLAQFFSEEQIYRIDHYLGKETVLNVLALRFANALFSENWNNHFIEKVQITVAEEIGVADRWGYYDKYGQIRDMLQNHVLQLLSLIAMEPPISLSAKDIRHEKLQVLRSLRLMNKNNIHQYVLRGQYESGKLDSGEKIVAYTQEHGADRNSQTETLVALKVYVDNERWSGVPFYLLTGKRLPKKCSEVVIYFKSQANSIFTKTQRTGFSNQLIIRLQPDEGVALSIMSKTPGFSGLDQLQKNHLDLNFYSDLKNKRIDDAYERLLLEIMSGNQSLFVSRQEIEQAWLWIDNIQSSLKEAQLPLLKYPSGTWGPNELKNFFGDQARIWDEDAVS